MFKLQFEIFYYFSVSRIFRSFKQRVEIGFRYLVHTFYMYKAMHISANHFDLLQFNAKCVSNPKRDSPQEMSIITLKGPPNIPKLKANSYTILKKGLLSKTALDYIFLVSCYYLSEIKVIIIITPPG